MDGCQASIGQVASDQAPPALGLSLLIYMREAGLEASKGLSMEHGVPESDCLNVSLHSTT